MKQYLKEHQAEALKEIAEGIGLEAVKIVSFADDEHELRAYISVSRAIQLTADNTLVVSYLNEGFDFMFDPLYNVDQWIECLFWYHKKIMNTETIPHFPKACVRSKSSYIANATASREALLIAILEYLRSAK